jgi:hypothetical protein
MGTASRDHEPAAVPAVVAAVLGPMALYMGFIVPAASMGQHVVLGAVFGIVSVASGWRALSIARRGQRGVRVWSWIAIVLSVLGLVMLVWQLLVIVTGGAFPSPFWTPYAHR